MDSPDSPSDSAQGTAPGRLGGIVSTVARWGLAIILVGVVVNLAMAASSIRGGATVAIDRVSPGWLIAAAALGLVPNLFHAWRIMIWAGFLGPPIGLLQALRTAFGTELGSAISPKAIGGAPVKVGLLLENGQSAGAATSIAMLNNVEDAVMFATVVPVFAVVTRRWEVPAVREAVAGVVDKLVAILPWLGAAVLVIVLWRLWRRSASAKKRSGSGGGVQGAFARVRDEFVIAWALIGRRGKSRFLAVVALSALQWACRCSVATAVMYGLGIAVDPVLFGLLQWVVFVMMIFVPTPGASLGAEASFAAILSGFVPAGLLGLVGAAWRFFAFYLVLLVGLAVLPAIGSPARQVSDP